MSDTGLPASKEELLARVREEWTALMDAAARLTPEQMLKPDDGGWSPKDNLAHLAEWMKILMAHHMDKRPAHEAVGVPPEVTEGWDMEKINPVLFERNRHRSTEEVLGELRAVYDELQKRLESMSFEQFLQPRHADDPEKRPLMLWILGDTAEHFEEHRQIIEKSS